MDEAAIQKLTARALKAAKKQQDEDLHAFQERFEATFSSELRSALALHYGWRKDDFDHPVAFFTIDGRTAAISEVRKGAALWRMEVRGQNGTVTFEFEGESDFLVKLKTHRGQIRQL